MQGSCLATRPKALQLVAQAIRHMGRNIPDLETF
jgi:hypothetical protein